MNIRNADRTAKAEARKKPYRIDSRTVIMLSPGARLDEVSDEFLKKVIR